MCFLNSRVENSLNNPIGMNGSNQNGIPMDQYESQLMFGALVHVTDMSNVFYLVWSYAVKDLDNRKKARCTCDGSSRGGKVRVLDHTYANCVDHTASRLFYAIAATENLVIFGADVSNAFSEAPPPKQGFYIQPDRAFKEWWMAKGRGEIPDGMVIPVMRAMQGHPELPRLWEKWCDKMVKDLKFKPTTRTSLASTQDISEDTSAISSAKWMILNLQPPTQKLQMSSMT